MTLNVKAEMVVSRRSNKGEENNQSSCVPQELSYCWDGCAPVDFSL